MISRGICLATFAVSTALSANYALAQGKSLRDQLIGTWRLASYQSIGADGAHKPIFGSHPNGTLMLDGGGHYAMILVDQDRPKKWSASSRASASVEELASAARGLVAQFGEWSADESAKTLNRKNVGALNPTAAGRAQKSQIQLSGDELTVVDASSGVSGTRTEAVWRREK